MSSVRALLSTSVSQSPLSSMFLNSSPSMEMFQVLFMLFYFHWLQLCTYKRPTYDHQVLRTSLSYAKHRNALWVSFCPNEELCRPHCSCNLRYQNKHARDTVARCELTAAGDSHSLSADLKMESKVRGACFYAVTTLSAVFLFVLMLVGHPFVLLFDRQRRKFHHYVAKVWASLTVAPFYRIKFEGLENLPPPDTPAVYVSNHQSFLDTYTLLTLGRSFKFISKTGIFLFPIIGWAMFLLGTIPLKRMDSRSQMDCVKRCMDLIRKGASVFFFPEGTRSRDGKLGAFKVFISTHKGAFSIAAKTNAPVVPITLIGTGQIMPAGREGIVNVGWVKVVIHKPLGGKDAEMLCKEARTTIASVL
ncbi:1-acyl-sn-glycerol-3-phosphate acyltransferase BAT2, chloroplastic-like isoform X1 [Arachis stenosperma]|uniref:1-acyl-sn-glycerol-3-phosphate acyltransferase BAT2, chloroplastic-like isoform X1 n=2 Tax=Arachis stenosperma TaxID=217475 RepID=UPI0025AB94EB|nr:1-acyl-sn-glycerol-3-phosphate acyltransferase BAT2, chloroplastic-like isoform X1 [Arachis stenosperma]XP_057726100.1 1-acyl-sn-glycerol-3-phosphate acyltransferase BAT2, chloroplastic-like isoform X1 [Arachis stenosperma]